MTDTLAPAAAMNRQYRRQRHIYDLTRAYYLLGRDRMLKALRPRPGETVLEIGCGTGRNLIHLTRLYPDARIFGFDVSTEMLASARAAIARAGVSGRVGLAHANAVGFSPMALTGRPAADRIFVSYCVSMIPDWRQVLDDAAGALAPGGQLHVVDFGAQERLPTGFKSALRWWLAKFAVTPRDDLEAALRAVAQRRGGHVAVERRYRGYTQYAVLTRPHAAA